MPNLLARSRVWKQKRWRWIVFSDTEYVTWQLIFKQRRTKIFSLFQLLSFRTFKWIDGEIGSFSEFPEGMWPRLRQLDLFSSTCTSGSSTINLRSLLAVWQIRSVVPFSASRDKLCLCLCCWWLSYKTSYCHFGPSPHQVWSCVSPCVFWFVVNIFTVN